MYGIQVIYLCVQSVGRLLGRCDESTVCWQTSLAFRQDCYLELKNRKLKCFFSFSSANTVSLETLGCPENSVFEDQQCICVIEGEGYDLNTFSCQPMDAEQVVEQIDEEESNEKEEPIPSSSPSLMASCVMFLSAILICFLYNN